MARAHPLLAFVAVVACACGPSDINDESRGRAVQPVTEGMPTTADPAVVGLLTAEQVSCSGVLVRPSVVLTAAHCLYGGQPDLIWASADGLEMRIGVTGRWPHPQHGIGRPDLDVGVLRLDRELDIVAVPLGPASSTPEVGMDVRIVGFGRLSAEDAASVDKREGAAVIDAVSSRTLTLAPRPSLACSGDSGAPVFGYEGGQESLLGVVSSGDEDCAEYSEVARVDAHWADFIAPLLARIDAASSLLGERCIHDGNCASGVCLAPPDAPDFAYCSAPCGDDMRCPEGFECGATSDRPAHCGLPSPSPGAIGAPCDADDDCQFGLCAAFGGKGFGRICSALCFAAANACPAATRCEPSISASGSTSNAGETVWGCVPTADGSRLDGCSVVHRPSFRTAGLHAAILGFGLLWRRRRQRRRYVSYPLILRPEA